MHGHRWRDSNRLNETKRAPAVDPEEALDHKQQREGLHDDPKLRLSLPQGHFHADRVPSLKPTKGRDQNS